MKLLILQSFSMTFYIMKPWSTETKTKNDVFATKTEGDRIEEGFNIRIDTSTTLITSHAVIASFAFCNWTRWMRLKPKYFKLTGMSGRTCSIRRGPGCLVHYFCRAESKFWNIYIFFYNWLAPVNLLKKWDRRRAGGANLLNSFSFLF